MSPRHLALDDIADARAYERERDAFRARIIELKKKRRVALGPVVSLVFENRDTIRFQIQEMARAERLLSDQAIQTELDTYNPLIPAPGELSATMYIELTSRAEMEEWLPKLVGLEQSIFLSLPSGVVRADVDPAHAANLTREEVTAAVHFVRFTLDDVHVAAFAAGPVAVESDHPSYVQQTLLGPAAVATLLDDLKS